MNEVICGSSFHNVLLSTLDVVAACGPPGQLASGEVVDVAIVGGGVGIDGTDTGRIALEDDTHGAGMVGRAGDNFQPAAVGGQRTGILHPCEVLAVEHVVVGFGHVCWGECLGL